jgi:dTDP-4-amino-4,6-dideoxygalactose transaminase
VLDTAFKKIESCLEVDYILGNEVREFESSFANYCGANFVLGREMVLTL